MRAVGLTRAGILAPIVGALARGGAPVDRWLAAARLPAWALGDPETLIPTVTAPRLLEQAARDGIDDIGLRAGEKARIEALGIYGRLIRGAPTLDEAVRITVRDHSTFSSNGRMWLVERGDRVDLCQAFTTAFDPLDAGWQQANHYILMLVLGIVRLAAGPGWRPAEVQIQTGECAAARSARALAGVGLAFGQPATVLRFPRALLAAPLALPAAGIDVPPDAIGEWRASAPARDFVESVAQVVDTLSWERYPDIRLTADVLGMSVRTLQRYLASADISHEALVGRARFATAAALLEETDAKILDIALDLGYSDHAHFTRAFHRWAGCSPAEFRRRRRNGGSAGTH